MRNGKLLRCVSVVRVAGPAPSAASVCESCSRAQPAPRTSRAACLALEKALQRQRQSDVHIWAVSIDATTFAGSADGEGLE